MMWKRTISLLISAVIGFFVLRWLVQRSSPTPDDLGLTNGRFTPCPNSPNCVSTFATDARHKIDSIPMTMSIHEAKVKLYNVIVDMPRTTIITNGPNYIHAEFRSAIWGFIDDVQIYLDETTQSIQFKSSSRLGYGDGNVNRKRMEAIRTAFDTTP